MNEKIEKLKSRIEKLKEENLRLREKNKLLKEKYQSKIERLELEKTKLKSKLEEKHIIDKPFKYVLDKYPDITKKIFEILNKHNVQFINRTELGKRIILLLEGDSIQKPIFTERKMNAYLDLVNSFSLDEYRKIRFAPIIKSDRALFENYEQTVRTLKPLSKTRNADSGFDFTNKNNS